MKKLKKGYYIPKNTDPVAVQHLKKDIRSLAQRVHYLKNYLKVLSQEPEFNNSYTA